MPPRQHHSQQHPPANTSSPPKPGTLQALILCSPDLHHQLPPERNRKLLFPPTSGTSRHREAGQVAGSSLHSLSCPQPVDSGQSPQNHVEPPPHPPAPAPQWARTFLALHLNTKALQRFHHFECRSCTPNNCMKYLVMIAQSFPGETSQRATQR